LNVPINWLCGRADLVFVLGTVSVTGI